jgi:hypothetical protein
MAMFFSKTRLRWMAAYALVLLTLANGVQAQSNLNIEYSDVRGYTSVFTPVTYTERGVYYLSGYTYKGTTWERPSTVLFSFTQRVSDLTWRYPDSIYLRFGNSRLEVPCTYNSSVSGESLVESVTCHLPLKTFVAFAKSKQAWVAVRAYDYYIPPSTMAPLRALAASANGSSHSGQSYTPSTSDGRLQLGSSGDDVKQWQLFLIKKGFMKPPALGNFASRTEAATKAFQKRYRLVADGIVGPKTLRKAGQLGFKQLDDG